MAPTQSKVMCIWLNQKQQPCPWQRMSENCDFCKRHSVYNGIYTKDDIKTLIWCSGCPGVFKQNDGEEVKQCIKCRTRGAQNREKNKENVKLCIGIKGTQKEKEEGIGSSCPNKQQENDEYCGKCQGFKKWKNLTDARNKVCKNWVRGCFECILDNYKKCQECRSTDQTKEKELAEKKLKKADDYDRLHNDKKMCVKCNKIDDTKKIINRQCVCCYDAYKKVESNRQPTNPLIRKLSDCKSSAKSKEIDWNISDELALKLIQSECKYCDKLVTLNGIDRIDSNLPYVETNIVSCCWTCNNMKGEKSVENFLKIVRYLLTINYYIEENIDNTSKSLFEFSTCGTYAHFKGDADKKGKSVEISKSMYELIVSKPCNYCKNLSKTGARGIDRVDSMFGYIGGNIVPCCKTCNCMKSNLSIANFFQHLLEIYNYSVLKIKRNMLSLSEQIMQLCKTVKPLKPEKFLKDSNYYNNLIFDSTKIEDIKKIKINLEVVRDKNQKDIWNYFRKHVSSLNKQHNAKLIGRQIYILVKDITSRKYLGIVSLSSDIQNLQNRDCYIGWNTQNRIEKLDYLMNMSTCVPLQPFGFNFNSGKLLASLAFSKEVLTEFYNSYGHELLGITTTSLYGKSIQYDRLKCLKYVGETKGNSVKDIPSEVTKLCSDYLKCEYNQNYPSRKKYIILQSAFNKLGLSKEDLLRSNKKGIYFGFTHPLSQAFILNEIKEIPEVRKDAKSANDIFKWWLNRWAIQRFEHLKSTNRLKTEIELYTTSEINSNIVSTTNAFIETETQPKKKIKHIFPPIIEDNSKIEIVQNEKKPKKVNETVPKKN